MKRIMCIPLLLPIGLASTHAALKPLADESMSNIQAQAGITIDQETLMMLDEFSYTDDGNSISVQDMRFSSQVDNNGTANSQYVIDINDQNELSVRATAYPTRLSIGAVTIGSGGSMGQMVLDYEGITEFSITGKTGGGLKGSFTTGISNANLTWTTDGHSASFNDIGYNATIDTLEVDVEDIDGKGALVLDMNNFDFSFSTGSLSLGGISVGELAGSMALSSRAEIFGGGRSGAEGISINSRTTILEDPDNYVRFMDEGHALFMGGFNGAANLTNLTLDVEPDHLLLQYDQLEGSFNASALRIGPVDGDISDPDPFADYTLGAVEIDYLFDNSNGGQNYTRIYSGIRVPDLVNAPSVSSNQVSLTSGQTLSAGDMLSNNSQTTLVQQDDGNLVMYDALGKSLWSTGTSGNPGAYSIMQPGGNLVVYSSTGTALWASATGGNNGSNTMLQEDGNLLINNSAGTPIWANGTFGRNVNYGIASNHTDYVGFEHQQRASAQRFYYGQAESDPRSMYRMGFDDVLSSGQQLTNSSNTNLTMQGDGNLVLQDASGTALWASNTAGNPGAYATMQEDGNFVVYDSSDNALWASSTTGYLGAQMVMQEDGNLVIYDEYGAGLWGTGTFGRNSTNGGTSLTPETPNFTPLYTQGVSSSVAWNLANAEVSYIDDGRRVVFSGIESHGSGDLTVNVRDQKLGIGMSNFVGSYSIDGLRVGNKDSELQGGAELLLSLEVFQAMDFELNGYTEITAGGATGGGVHVDGDYYFSNTNFALSLDETENGVWATGVLYDIHLRDFTVDVEEEGILINRGEQWSTMDIADMRWGNKNTGRSLGRIKLERFERDSSLLIQPGGAGQVCVGATGGSSGECTGAGGRWEDRGNQGMTVALKAAFADSGVTSDRRAIARNRLTWENNRRVIPGNDTRINGSGTAIIIDNYSTNDGLGPGTDNTHGLQANLNIDVYETRVLKKGNGVDANGVTGNAGDELIYNNSDRNVYSYVETPSEAQIANRPLGFAVQGNVKFKELYVDAIQLKHPDIAAPQTVVYGAVLQNFNLTTNLTATPIQ